MKDSRLIKMYNKMYNKIQHLEFEARLIQIKNEMKMIH